MAKGRGAVRQVRTLSAAQLEIDDLAPIHLNHTFLSCALSAGCRPSLRQRTVEALILRRRRGCARGPASSCHDGTRRNGRRHSRATTNVMVAVRMMHHRDGVALSLLDSCWVCRRRRHLRCSWCRNRCSQDQGLPPRAVSPQTNPSMPSQRALSGSRKRPKDKMKGDRFWEAAKRISPTDYGSLLSPSWPQQMGNTARRQALLTPQSRFHSAWSLTKCVPARQG